jgi:ATP-dependent helicase/nuclease subunit A
MADLERAAETLLSRSELSGWVQERLDQRLRHVLIDEFQDTSPLQWQALHGWLSAYSGAGGGASGQRPPSVFMVGDPKQSIYRFRGADPRIFEAARDFVVVGLQGQVLECDHTRRNAPAVVAALNTVFARAGSEEGWGPFREHSTGSKVAGHVRRLRTAVRQAAEPGRAAKPAIWRDSLTQARDEPDRQVRAEEATCIAQAVAQLIQAHGLSPGEIIVLARRRSVLAFVAEALGAAALPHLVAEPLALKTSPEALDLIAVLDVLASPGHDLALARALKSPLFAASDDDLLTLSQAARGGPHWLATLLQTDQWHSVALGRARALLSAWSRAALVLPPHDLLDRIVHEGDLMARLVAAVPPTRRKGALQAVHALLGSSLAQQGGRFASIYGFVREFRAGRLRGTGVAPVDAVQLLTVHGAKGLEARAVIVADADPVPRPTERASVLVDWPVESEAPVGVAFLGKHSALPPSAAELWQAEQRAKDREELNGLYVAMTRAREWLLFSRTPPSRPATGASWWQRVVEQAAPWPLESDATPSVDITQAIAAPAVPIRLPTSVPVLPEFDRPVEPAPPVPAAQGPAARLGQAVHRLLEWAGHPGSPLPPDQRPAAAAAAAASFGLAPGDGAEAPDAATQVLQLAEQILLSPACSRFFTGRALIWAANEVPLASAGSVLRVDRLVALAEGTDTIWWVLDYKLHGAPQGVDAYRAQMALYVAAVQTLQPGDRVRGAFITGDGKCIEI